MFTFQVARMLQLLVLIWQPTVYISGIFWAINVESDIKMYTTCIVNTTVLIEVWAVYFLCINWLISYLCVEQYLRYTPDIYWQFSWMGQNLFVLCLSWTPGVRVYVWSHFPLVKHYINGAFKYLYAKYWTFVGKAAYFYCWLDICWCYCFTEWLHYRDTVQTEPIDDGVSALQFALYPWTM